MVRATMDSREIDRFLAKFPLQVPFVMRETINATLIDAQRRQRRHMRRVFQVRQKRWVDQSVKIKPFATKQKAEGTISIDPPGNKDNDDILAKFEDGGLKTPRGKHLAIPARIRRTKAGAIRKGTRPKDFNFRRVGRTIRGDKRTFIIPGVGVFQRKGRKVKRGGKASARRRAANKQAGRDKNITLLYSLKPSARIPKALDFIRNAELTVRKDFDRHLSHFLDKAIATAR